MLRKFLLTLALCLPLAAAAQEAPDALVKRVTGEVLAIIKADKDLQSGNTRKIAELAEVKVLPHFDFTRMTRLAVGRNWAQATDAQKAALEKEFRTLLVRTYSTIDGASLVTTYRGSFNDQIQKGGIDALVKTLVDRNKAPAAEAKK